MHFLSLVVGSGLAGADSPYGFVSEHELREILGRKVEEGFLDLLCHYFEERAVLTLLEHLERRVNVGNEARTIRLKVKGIVSSIQPYRQVLEDYGIHLSKVYVEYDYEQDTTRMNLVILIKEHSDFIDVFDSLHNILPTITISLSNQADLS